MARKIEQWAESLSTEQLSGWLTGFLAEEDVFDRRALFRLGSWGAGALGALIVAILAGQASSGQKREQIIAADLARQAQQIQTVAKDSQSESRRLAMAIETLGGDRDRLYSRLTVLEQSLDSVTGLLARLPKPGTPAADPAPTPMAANPPQAAVTAAPAATDDKQPAKIADAAKSADTTKSVATLPAAPPAVLPMIAAGPPPQTPAVAKPAAVTAANPSPANNPAAATTGAGAPPSAAYTSLMGSKSIMGPPDAAAAKLREPAVPPPVPPAPAPETVASIPAATDATPIAVQRTEFGVDLGGANSVAGLRALWRGLSKSNPALAELHPIIVVKERNNGLGMHLRLVAGPLSDAAAAAKFCAPLTESGRACETSVFDGQRLAVKEEPPRTELPRTEAPKTTPAAAADGAKPDAPKPEQAKSEHAAPPAPVQRPARGRTSRHIRVEQRTERVEEPAPAPAPKPRSWIQSVLGAN